MKQTAENRTPDWSLWAHAGKVKLWEAVALSLNIDPGKVRFHPQGWMAGPGSGPVFKESPPFDGRVAVALSNLSTKGPLVPISLYAGVLQDRAAEIYLSAFGAWAESIGWTLPLGFPASVPTAPPSDEERNRNLIAFHARLKAQGHRAPTRETASEFEISEDRVRQILRTEKAEPSPKVAPGRGRQAKAGKPASWVVPFGRGKDKEA